MKPTLHRRDVVNALLADRGDLLVITGLGSTAWDATAAGDHDLTFPLWGAMGSAVMIGLGLAIAKPRRRVLVLTGDGEMLMGLGSLATAGVQKSKNLSVVVIDNERYGETGMQQTHTASGVSLDEESINMLSYQRQFQAAARYIATIDETLQTLLSIV